MKIILNILCISFIFITINTNVIGLAYAIGNVDWLLLKENNDGKEWLDMGSIKVLRNDEISVLTKFFKKPINSKDEGKLSLYVMRINCNNKKYKDTSINGIPNLNSTWQSSNNDELIDIVIEKSCSEIINF